MYNYIQIQRTGDNLSTPCKVIQMFNDKEMVILGKGLTEFLNHSTEEQTPLVSRLIHLFGQWEDEHL